MFRSSCTISEFCGNLTVVQQNNSVGSTTQLVFISNKPTYNMEWFHWDDSKYQLLDKNIRSKYEETQSQNLQKFVFKIYKSNIKDAGLYKARCGNQIYSNTVQVNVGKTPLYCYSVWCLYLVHLFRLQ